MLPTLFLHLIAGTISIPTVVDGYHHHGSNRIAFQLSRAHHRKSAKPSMIRASDVSAEADWNNDALRHTIDKLVSIIGPDDSSKTVQSMSSLSSSSTTQSSIVHIIGTGLCPTLLNLPLSTLHILSQADVVLHDSLGLSYQDIIKIVPKHCEVICVGKRGDKKSWKQTDIGKSTSLALSSLAFSCMPVAGTLPRPPTPAPAPRTATPPKPLKFHIFFSINERSTQRRRGRLMIVVSYYYYHSCYKRPT